jgi:putative phosphoribosyl transferase
MDRIFQNRREAGRLLAGTLQRYADREEVLVLGIPRGGVPVAYEVARALHAPLEVFVVRKVGMPGNPELAMGAVASGGIRIYNPMVLRQYAVAEKLLQAAMQKQEAEVRRRESLYGSDRAWEHGREGRSWEHKTVILVDDGLATGCTMRAAVRALKARRPARIVVAVPTASAAGFAEMRFEVEECAALLTPREFQSVGEWYAEFPQTTDAEVAELLRLSRQEHAAQLPKEVGAAPGNGNRQEITTPSEERR